MTLDDLIQRAMLIQAAKRKLKDEKNWGKMLKYFDKAWVEHELPQQIQKHHATDEHDLEQILKKRGLSLKAMREDFKLKTAAIEFLRAEILPKAKVDLPEMLAYYDAHMHDFDHGPLIRWREVEVKVSRHKDRAEALRKAEVTLERLRKGEPFDAVARGASEGTNAKDGGAWETSPDSCGIPAINDALNTLPVKQGQRDPRRAGQLPHPAHRVPPRGRAGHLRRGPGPDPEDPPGREVPGALGRLFRQAPQPDPHLHHVRRHRQRPDALQRPEGRPGPTLTPRLASGPGSRL